MRKITPFLWFDGKIAEAVAFYSSVFSNAKVLDTKPGPDDALMSATLDIEGQQFILFNGGPHYTLSPAFSMYINCKDQEEIDRLWTALTNGGKESRCGWLIDPFGLSWQVIPEALPKLLQDKDREKAGRVMQAMLQMGKIDVAAMEKAAAG